MYISRKTDQELVIVDSLLWIAVPFLCAFVVFAYRAVIQPSRDTFLAAAFLLLFGLVPLRRETVVFDAVSQQARWWRLRVFKTATGTVPFSEITGIGIEALASDRGGSTYRLTILTHDKPVPMADAYGNSRKRYEAMQQEILTFLKIDSARPILSFGSSPSGVVNEASVRALLQEGRKIAAIELVRSDQNVSLAEATDLVTALDEKMKAVQ